MSDVAGMTPAGTETRVLLIEDSPSERMLIEHYLQQLPFAIHLDTAETLRDGKQKIDAGKFDCILLDYWLPDGNSLPLLKSMKESNNQAAVIVVSSSDDRDFQQTLLASGASDYIHKSYLNKSVLNRAIGYAQARQAFVQKIYRQEEENRQLMAALRDTNAHLDEMVELRTAQFQIAQQTAREKARQAEQASKVKSEFLATMSHEIRTPLNGVVGMLDLLEMTTLDDEQKEFLQTAKTSAQLLLSLISDILDISRIEAGRFELEDSGFDLRDIMSHIGQLLRSKAETKGLGFSVRVSPLLYPHLMGDAVRLRQVLINLGDNAIKYTDRGEVIITIQRMQKTDDQNSDHEKLWMRFSVQDTGIGISPELQEKIFQPFTQVDSSFTRRHGGTGLGLAIVARLVDIMGGEIALESTPGKGSTFTCDLPFYKCRVHKAEDVPLLNLANKKILLVEADAHGREGVRYWLQQWGARVQAVKNGCSAMPWLTGEMEAGVAFDAAFIADDLPDIDGAVLREAACKVAKATPLHVVRIVSESFSPVDSHYHAMISKPVVAEELAASLAALGTLEELLLAASDAATSGFKDMPQEVSMDVKGSVGRHLQEKHILLVEDNPTNQLVAASILEKIGYGVIDCVDNGEEALELLLHRRFDLVLMDCQLPGMDGYEITRRIRDQEKQLLIENPIPIIAMTANAMSGDRERCLEAGMNDYMAKPVVFNTLKEKVASWINSSH